MKNNNKYIAERIIQKETDVRQGKNKNMKILKKMPRR